MGKKEELLREALYDTRPGSDQSVKFHVVRPVVSEELKYADAKLNENVELNHS